MRKSFWLGPTAMWKRSEFWIAAVALFVPFGWLILLFRSEGARSALRALVDLIRP